MAGYFLYTISNPVFTQLTHSPTKEQGLVLAGSLRDYLEEAEASPRWPRHLDALADRIVQRLALPDWYSDLTYDDAQVWDEVIRALEREPGEALGIDFQCSDYESIYWDCAELAAGRGATMMAEPTFGSSGFRYFGKPADNHTNYPTYSLFTPGRLAVLLRQLEEVEPHFTALPGGGDSPREQFFEGLLPAVRYAVEKDRMLWVQTDT